MSCTSSSDHINGSAGSVVPILGRNIEVRREVQGWGRYAAVRPYTIAHVIMILHHD